MGANLTDRVAVITGGSRGIGRATAIAAAARGFKVCVGYASNEAAARHVVSAIEAKNGKAIAASPSLTQICAWIGGGLGPNAMAALRYRSSTSRAGSSRLSLTRTRKVTASLPSMTR